ncbi:MAG: hypothetical protein EA379_05270 [Phycisphaerales bacterium]|nr:MAG: hypothetical protein EA379_05270 [Phycisphaerales bacterium]
MKSRLALYAAQRSATAVVGFFAAATLAVLGVAGLLGAGYVVMAERFGSPIALGAVGVTLLLIAASVALIASRHARSSEQGVTEASTRECILKGEEMLRSVLGITDVDNEAREKSAHTRDDGPVNTNLDSPKVMMAAGFAVLGLLGPGRVFRAIRIATAVGSLAALANRAITDSRNKEGERSDQVETPARAGSKHGPDGTPDSGRSTAPSNQRRTGVGKPLGDNFTPSHSSIGPPPR